MAYFNNNYYWESEFDSIASSKDRVQDVNVNQLKLKVNDAYENYEKMTTKNEASVPEDVGNKTFLDKKIIKNRRSHLLYRKRLQRK